jgi:FkbM family methyltransferase
MATIVNGIFPATPSNAKVWAAMRLHYSILVDLRSTTEYLAYYLGDYDTESIRGLLRLFRPEWTILDVGANIGFYTIPMASAVQGGGRLHAFEPLACNCSRLNENVRRNGLDHVVQLHQIGLSDQNAVLRISLREDFAKGAETGNAAIVIDHDDERFACLDVRVAPLDEIVPSLAIDRLDFVKLDIEGHEDKFLAGARGTIQRFRPIIFLEINDRFYERRGLDATAVFERWQGEASYNSAFELSPGAWGLQGIRERKGRVENVLLLPSENAESVINRLRH